MNKATQVMGAAVGGVAGGFALAFLLCAGTAVLAAVTGTEAVLPGLFQAKAGTENGALALEFQPNVVGTTVVVGLSAAVSIFLAVRRTVSTVTVTTA